MKAATVSLRDRIRTQLADLRMPGALEALDDVLQEVDGGKLPGPVAIERLLGAQIALRNNRPLAAAMRSSRLPAVKMLSAPRRRMAGPARPICRAGCDWTPSISAFSPHSSANRSTASIR